MSNLYHIGLVIGLIIVYLLVTFGIAAVLNFLHDPDLDSNDFVIIAYIVGIFIFLFLSTQLLDEKGCWNLPQLQIIEELETEVME